jgi:hypothetical protein
LIKVRPRFNQGATVASVVPAVSGTSTPSPLIGTIPFSLAALSHQPFHQHQTAWRGCTSTGAIYNRLLEKAFQFSHVESLFVSALEEMNSIL